MEVLRTPFYQNIPQAFRYEDIKGDIHFAGAYAQTIKHFAKYQRYDFQFVALENVKVSHIQRGIQQGIYNISMHAVGYKNLFANISFSYPVEWSRVCIMVPAEDELPRYWYVVWPFGPYIWTIICISVVYIAILMRFLKHPTANFVTNLLTSLAVVLNCSNMNLKLVNTGRRLQFFYTLLFLMGFVLNSYYCCYLTVYNMRPVFQPFLRTADDLLKANRLVWVPSNILEELRNNPYENLTRIEPMIVEKSQLEVSEKMQNFSRHYAYMVTQNDWIFMGKLQRNLIQPLFQLSDMCSANKFNTFPIPYHAKFSHDLDFFILLVQQSGLWDFWQEEAFMAAIQSKYYRILQDAYPIDPLNLYYYRFAWIVLFGGSILASICVVVEVIVHNYRSRVKRLRSSTSISFIQEIY